MSKFQRNYEIEIQTADGSTIIVGYPYTLDFSIEQNTFASANTGRFTLYNIGESIRNRVYKSKYDITVFRTIELRAGYGQTLSTVFKGTVKEAMSYKQEGQTNHLTVIDSYDGGYALANSFSSFTLAAGTSKNDTIKMLSQDLIDTEPGAFSEFDGTNIRGRAVMGNTGKILQDETEGHFFINKGKLYCLKNNDCIEGEIVVINAQTGLLGSPRRTDTLLQVDLLFEPRLKIGQIVELESITERIYNGKYKVAGIQHSGTISGAVAGKCKTIVSLWYGTGALTIIPDYVNREAVA